ncbi:flagellar biosynthetic protein FliO [Halochromatium glycolicum]|uniref:Flagellar protein n=1 Tax=Halochromatium glycolicum TaxID=85075 RepID=A0AAJ0U153_9GAMM|nr:flagellar biosynthetic protein FliO [Halochromatium glycolicum]MBK1703336.1 flagellar biosynthetic protein FliO [Halochromatium glycolicum]
MNEVASGDTLVGFAELAKLSVALLVIVLIILTAAFIVRRFRAAPAGGGAALKVIGSTAVGLKERVVIVQVDSTWLVLGVGGGQVTRLHKLPAPSSEQVPGANSQMNGPQFEPDDSFATRFAKALKHNIGLR